MGDPTRILVPQKALVYLAPVGTIAPAGPTVAMPSGWTDVGLFTPDSLSWTTDPSFEEVRSHQSNYPTRRFQTTDAATLEVDLQEWSSSNFRAVFGGGTFTQVAEDTQANTPAYFRFSPPAIGARDTVAACVEIQDDTKIYRRIIPRAQQVAGVTQTLSRTAASTLPLRLSVLGGDVGDPWYDMSTDDAFAPPVPVGP
jgi:hypothetical protein